jgi:predicted metalloprotease
LLLLGFLALNYFSSGEREPAPQRNDPAVEFVSFVFDDAQSTWAELFGQHGRQYQKAKLVIYRQGTPTGCGFGSAAAGPFYCPNDRTVYIDLAFYEELRRRFGAPGDFAQAYVIAHEVGHHVQNLLNLLSDAAGVGARGGSVRQELQADCLAGVWARSTASRGLLEPGDLNEALRAAAAIGDDAIQRKTGGTVHPESWSHGSSEQRQRWLSRGYKEGRLEACNTQAAPNL